VKASERNILRRGFINLCLIISSLIMLASCESGGGANNGTHDLNEYGLDFVDSRASEQGITTDKLTLWWNSSFGSEISLEKFVHDPLTSRYEGVRFETVYYQDPVVGDQLNEFELSVFNLIREEQIPDIVFFKSDYLRFFLEIDFLQPIEFESLLNLDTDVLRDIRSVSPDLQLYALPFGESKTGLFYNRQIFDEMNVPYPTDGMSWDEVISLAHQVADPDQRAALVIGNYDGVGSQLELQIYDDVTQSLDLTSENWRHLEELARSLKGTESNIDLNANAPFGFGEAAMVIDTVASLLHQEYYLNLHQIDWDIARYPVFRDGRSLAPGRDYFYVGIPRKSEHKEDAIQVVRYLMSEEVQSEMMRMGLASLRNDIAIDQFGASTTLAGKSITSLFHSAQSESLDHRHEYSWLGGLVRSFSVWDDVEIIRSVYEELVIRDISVYTEAYRAFIDEMRARSME